jgi:hypothetical protein
MKYDYIACLANILPSDSSKSGVANLLSTQVTILGKKVKSKKIWKAKMTYFAEKRKKVGAS